MVTLEDLIEKYNVDRAGIEREKAKLLARIEAYELAEIRKQAGLTQVQLAESMGGSQKRNPRMGEMDSTLLKHDFAQQLACSGADE